MVRVGFHSVRADRVVPRSRDKARGEAVCEHRGYQYQPQRRALAFRRQVNKRAQIAYGKEVNDKQRVS